MRMIRNGFVAVEPTLEDAYFSYIHETVGRHLMFKEILLYELKKQILETLYLSLFSDDL